MRDYHHIDHYLTLLQKDIYAQPPDEGHSRWAKTAITDFSAYFKRGMTVLDVGCGSGFCAPYWQELGLVWTGVTLGSDANAAQLHGLDIRHGDMSFLPFDDATFDVVFARHVLEHSPMPLLTLMEWHRVSRRYLMLVAPAPDHWGYAATNHYAVMLPDQLEWLANRAGWNQAIQSVMTNHSADYLDAMSERGREEALRIRPPLDVEYRYLFRRRS